MSYKLYILLAFLIYVVMSCGDSPSGKYKHGTPVEGVEILGEDSLFSPVSHGDTIDFTDSLYPYSETVNSELKFGYMNYQGNKLTEPVFDLAGPFYQGYAPVVQNQVHGLIDTTGELIYIFQKYKHALWYDELAGVYEFSGVSEGMYKIQINDSSFGYINQKHQVVTKKYYPILGKFSNGRASFYNNKTNMYGYINTLGNEIIDAHFEHARPFSENRASVTLDGKIGFIDTTGVLIIPAIYTAAGYFSQGLCHVTISENSDRYYYVDVFGNTIIAGPYENASEFSGDTAVIYKRGTCRIIDKTGKELRKLNWDYFAGC